MRIAQLVASELTSWACATQPVFPETGPTRSSATPGWLAALMIPPPPPRTFLLPGQLIVSPLLDDELDEPSFVTTSYPLTPAAPAAPAAPAGPAVPAGPAGPAGPCGP